MSTVECRIELKKKKTTTPTITENSPAEHAAAATNQAKVYRKNKFNKVEVVSE